MGKQGPPETDGPCACKSKQPPKDARRRPRKPRAPYRPHRLYRTPLPLATVRATRAPRGGTCRGRHLRGALAAFPLRRLEELRSRFRLVSMVEVETVDGRSVADGLADCGGRYVQGTGGGRIAPEGLTGFQADDRPGLRMAFPEDLPKEKVALDLWRVGYPSLRIARVTDPPHSSIISTALRFCSSV